MVAHVRGRAERHAARRSIGAEFTIAGFIRRKAGAPGLCNAWRAGPNNSKSLRLAADGTVRLAWGGRTLTTATGVAQEGVWHHVAATNDATNGLRLWVDGTVVESGAVTTDTLDGLAWQMARGLGGAAVDLALDEWGIWSEALDVAALYARQTHHRAFGGYVYGVVDGTDLGPADQHVLSLSLAGYGLRLDHSYVRQIYASASGSTVREIVQNVLELAGSTPCSPSHGVELDDMITRAPSIRCPVRHDHLARAGRPARGHRDG